MTEAKIRRCFVISPIGADGTEIREHADDVFEFIIEPAMKELGIYGYRSDQNVSAGRITEQMFASLLKEDLCVAILTFYNPNVFYELAIAQSAARPTVLMIEKGTILPFDIRDIRAIEYDFKPRAIRDGVYVRQLIDHVRSIEQGGWRVEVPFGPALSPLGLTNQAVRIYDDISSFGSEERWLSILAGAKERFYACGIAMLRWTGHRFRNLMLDQAKAGCEIRLMMMDHDNPALPGMINEADSVGSMEQVTYAINEVRRVATELSQASERIQMKFVKRAGLHHQLVLTERYAVARLYFYSRTTSEAPILYLEKPSLLTDAFDKEFETLWRIS